MSMDKLCKYELIDSDKDIITLVSDIERVISKQGEINIVRSKLDKYELMSYRKDIIKLISDLQRVIYKQGDLIQYGHITESKAKENIERFKLNIQENLTLIKVLENQLEIEFNVIVKYEE